MRGEKTAGGRGLEEREGSRCLAPRSPEVRADTRLGVSPAKLSCWETDGHQEGSGIELRYEFCQGTKKEGERGKEAER